MNVSKLLEGINYKIIKGVIDIEVKGISYDSRNINKDYMFVAMKGTQSDGHDYIKQSIINGAICILVENENLDLNDPCYNKVCIIKIEALRRILPQIVDEFYEFPSKGMSIIGITGTCGKTSVTQIISHILNYNEFRNTLIGTIENRVGDRNVEIKKTNATTPNCIELNQILDISKNENINKVVMEVSSMALELSRVDHINFNSGIFTNLSHEHLDDHKTFQNYKNAKMKLFDMCNYKIINIDDKVGEEIALKYSENVITYALNKKADFIAKDIQMSVNGSEFIIENKGVEKVVRINLPGVFNIYNTLAAIIACNLEGVSIEDSIKALEIFKGISGRFEVLKLKNGVTAIIDYAHTPDSLQKILTCVKQIGIGKLYLVFGCGGDRDSTKRPIMGRIAMENADYTIITSDNPRNEEPMKIITEIEMGFQSERDKYEVIVDRKEAIIKCLNYSTSGDCVVIAGKGHETYQLLKNRTIYFSDKEIVKDYDDKLN